MLKLLILAAVVAVSCVSLDAQMGPYPGQYPGQYPGGQYPGGQYPGGGISIPGRNKSPQSKQKKNEASAPTFSADGATVSNDGKRLVIATEDGRTITMAVTESTKFTRSGQDITSSKVVPRTTVHVDASEDQDANLTAVKVDLLKDAPRETADESSPTALRANANPEDNVRPTILDNPVDAPGRPILRRGIPKDTTSASDQPDVAPLKTNKSAGAAASNTVAQNKQTQPSDFTIDSDSEKSTLQKPRSQDLISRAIEWAGEFSNGLPNFVCEQMTTRYMEQSRSTGWQPIDVVTAKVIYEDGQEQYSDITVGGRKTNKSMMELGGGSTSTGEFATTLRSLFDPYSQAQFKLAQSTTVNDKAAAIYDFKVALAHSTWEINVGGQMLRPAYSGSVWIDKDTAEVRRIEMQADNVPKDFPLDSVEWAVDYDDVSLGEAAKFLLPVHAENLSCQRGTSLCSKNTIDFRNYHKYAGESTIEFK